MNALDVSLSVLSAYASIRGTTAPFTAPETSQKGTGSDIIKKLGITRISSLYHALLVIVTVLQAWKMLSLQGTALESWQSNRMGFRLMNVVNILGGALRVVCFRELGRFFTFDLAVQPDQKVIQTGPYAYVRHPSYTAMILHEVGSAFGSGVFGPLVPPHWRQRAALINVGLTGFAVAPDQLAHCGRRDDAAEGSRRPIQGIPA